jgi:hypothetical protein
VGAGGLEGADGQGELGVEAVAGGHGAAQLVGIDVEVECLDGLHERFHGSQQGT